MHRRKKETESTHAELVPTFIDLKNVDQNKNMRFQNADTSTVNARAALRDLYRKQLFRRSRDGLKYIDSLYFQKLEACTIFSLAMSTFQYCFE